MFNWIAIWAIVENLITWIGPAAALGGVIAILYWLGGLLFSGPE